jgi:phospholipase C
VKYVFVLFQENRSFDFYFSRYPGADGPLLRTHRSFHEPIAGFTQPIVNTDGTLGTISPFKIPTTVVDANGKTVPLYPVRHRLGKS